MNFIINNEEIFIEDIKLDESEMIESSNSHEIMYNMKQIAKNILGCASNNSFVCITFHIYSIGSVCQNAAAADTLKYI